MKLSRLVPLALMGTLACEGEMYCPQGSIVLDAHEAVPRTPFQEHLIDVTVDDGTRPIQGNPTTELWRGNPKKPSAALSDQPVEISIENAGNRILVITVRLTASATLADSQGFPDKDPNEDELFKEMDVLITGENPELIGCPTGVDCIQTVDTSSISPGFVTQLFLDSRERLSAWLSISNPSCQ